MTQALAHILEAAARLTAAERAELADRIVESVADDIPDDVARAQLTEVRRRIAQVEAGGAELVPGDEALPQVRRLVAGARPATGA